MKLRIYSYIATIILVVLATAGCLEPADTAVNATPEPTPEPCETCTVPEGFCGPPGVCPGEPVNGVYVFTDKNAYRIGEVVEFGIVNCGEERRAFVTPDPWWIQRWVVNTSGCTPENCTGGMWETIGRSGISHTGDIVYLYPGDNWTVQWDTASWDAARGKNVEPVGNSTLTPGTYRIWIWNGINISKEFEFV
ncbi:hypothetical protein [Methanoculleus sp.]|uniref:hypothetical protein n=1 Tax=Methanoculleus sp. TaxID=90427 RepID=UPI00320C3EF6